VLEIGSHNVDEELLLDIISGIIRIVQKLEEDELGGLIDAPNEF
jgi:hypothetical protein